MAFQSDSKFKAKFYAHTADLSMAEAKRFVQRIWERSLAAGGYQPQEAANLKANLPGMIDVALAQCAPDVRCFLESVEGPENLAPAAIFAELEAARSFTPPTPTTGGATTILLGLGILVGILALTGRR